MNYRHLDVDRPIAEHLQDVRRQLKYRHVVDLVTDVTPGFSQAGKFLPQRFLNRGDIFVHHRKAVLEGQRIEKHQAPDSQGGGAVLLLVGAGDYVGNPAGYAGMLRDLYRRLLQRVPDRAGSGRHPVYAFKLQWKRTQLVRKLRHRTVAN